MVMFCQHLKLNMSWTKPTLFLPHHSCLQTFCFVSGITISLSPGTKPQRHSNYFFFLVPVHHLIMSILLPSGQMVFTSVISLSYPLPCAEFGLSFQAKPVASSHGDVLYSLYWLVPVQNPSHSCLTNFRVMSENTVGIGQLLSFWSTSFKTIFLPSQIRTVSDPLFDTQNHRCSGLITPSPRMCPHSLSTPPPPLGFPFSSFCSSLKLLPSFPESYTIAQCSEHWF